MSHQRSAHCLILALSLFLHLSHTGSLSICLTLSDVYPCILQFMDSFLSVLSILLMSLPAVFQTAVIIIFNS